jgi:hypothetical protein
MPHALKLLLAALLSTALVAPSAALATDGNRDGTPPSSEPVTVSFEVVSASTETRIAKVVLECAGGYSGNGVAVRVGPGVEISAFTAGAHLAGKVNRNTDPPTLVALLDSTCGDATPAPQEPDPPVCPGASTRNDSGGDRCPAADDPAPGCPTGDPAPTTRAHDTGNCGTDNGDGGSEDQPAAPKFRPSFLNRVWRFEGSADSYEAGVLGMTVETVKGLPKRLRDQDDELLDQDALVLVGTQTKVYGVDGKRTTADSLADADRVSVRGKLLPPAKWRDDVDGQPTPTLRAKRVYVLG